MSRVMIICPVTERPVPTRLEAEPVSSFRRSLPESGSLTCEACGRRHSWSRPETLLEGQPRPRGSRHHATEPRSAQPTWVMRHVEMGRR
jgi:hypothetical protein